MSLDSAISVKSCPLHSIREHCEEVMDNASLSQQLKDRNILWHYIGRAAADVKNRKIAGNRYDSQETDLVWRSFVHDCTFDSPLSQKESLGLTLDRMQDLCKEKSKVLQAQSQEVQWFERTFQVLDRALFDGSKTLVHCAQGKSRSASIVAAFLIKRLGLSAEEAVRYLQIRRLCVNPGFIEPLQAYSKALVPRQSS